MILNIFKSPPLNRIITIIIISISVLIYLFPFIYLFNSLITTWKSKIILAFKRIQLKTLIRTPKTIFYFYFNKRLISRLD